MFCIQKPYICLDKRRTKMFVFALPFLSQSNLMGEATANRQDPRQALNLETCELSPPKTFWLQWVGPNLKCNSDQRLCL